MRFVRHLTMSCNVNLTGSSGPKILHSNEGKRGCCQCINSTLLWGTQIIPAYSYQCCLLYQKQHRNIHQQHEHTFSKKSMAESFFGGFETCTNSSEPEPMESRHMTYATSDSRPDSAMYEITTNRTSSSLCCQQQIGCFAVLTSIYQNQCNRK